MEQVKFVMRSPLTMESAWQRCLQLAEVARIATKIDAGSREVELSVGRVRPRLYWWGVAAGLMIYIVPGLIALWMYRRILLTLRFREAEEGVLIAVEADANSNQYAVFTMQLAGELETDIPWGELGGQGRKPWRRSG